MAFSTNAIAAASGPVTIRAYDDPVSDSAGVPYPGHVEGAEVRRKQRIDWSYAIAAKEVTLAQFLQFRKDHQADTPSEDCPVDTVSWHEAAAYCNWVSKRLSVKFRLL